MTQNCVMDPKNREEAIAGLRDGRWAVRLRSAWWLDHADDRAALPSLVALTRDPKRQVRQFATFAVGRQRDDPPFPDAIPILMERALEDTSPRVRRVAVQILAYSYAHPDLCGFFQALLDTEQDPKLHKLAGIGLWLSRGVTP